MREGEPACDDLLRAAANEDAADALMPTETSLAMPRLTEAETTAPASLLLDLLARFGREWWAGRTSRLPRVSFWCPARSVASWATRENS